VTRSEKQAALRRKIRREKSKLNQTALRRLELRRHEVSSGPEIIRRIAEAAPPYHTLSEREKAANGSARRIDHILFLEFEYAIAGRSLSRRMLDFCRENATWLIATKAAGATGAALGFYLTHREALEQLLAKILSGLLYRRTDGGVPLPLAEATPEDVLLLRSHYEDQIDIEWLEETVREGRGLMVD
jgi:hypothetical protein